MLIASAIIAIVAIAAIAPRWQAIRQYYVIGHVTGREGQIRAREQGVNSLGARLVFYPRSLLENHAGPEILLWCGGGLVLAAGASMLLVQGARRSSTRRGGSPIDGTAWAFVIACLMVPLGALTGDVAKSPVVADIMVAPLLWLFLLSLIALARLGRGMPSPRNVRVALSVFAAALLLDGMRVQANEYSRRTAGGSQREQVQKLLALYDRIADCAQALGWRSPTFAANSNADWAYCRSIEAMSFERHGFALSGDEVLADTLFARPPAEQIERLRRADFIILIRYPTDRPSPLSYPFDQQMRELEPRLRQWCDANLISIAHDRLAEPFNCEVTVYVRPAVSVVGERDGWITRSGSKIVALAESLRRWPAIDFWGRRAGESLPQPPHVSARIMASGRAISTPARLSYEGPEYHFNVHVNPADLLRQELVQIDLAFDSSFTPRQVNGTPDDRDLVIRLPTRGEIHPEQ